MTRMSPVRRPGRLCLTLGCIGGLALGLACSDERDPDTARETPSPSALGGTADRDDPAHSGAADVAARGPRSPEAAEEGFEDHRPDGVEVLVARTGDIPLLVPSAVIVAEGTRSIRVRNESGQDHVFAIEGGEQPRETRLPAGEQVTVQLGDVEPRGIYALALRGDSASSADAAPDDPAGDSPARDVADGEEPDDATANTGQEAPRSFASGGTLVVLPASSAQGARSAAAIEPARSVRTSRLADPAPSLP